MANSEPDFSIGVDIGSTTLKCVVINKKSNKILFESYKRHGFKIIECFQNVISNIKNRFGNISVNIGITGSIGMGLCEKFDIPFTQEVVASARAVNKLYKDVTLLIDIGGEDSKIIFFYDKNNFDIRMNGNCAGGTGAFIDQLSSIIDIKVCEIEKLSQKSTKSYSIAGRCGVFAKSDVQNLLSKNIKKADIVKSVLQAICVQTLNTLIKGSDISPKVLFSGGPLTFIPTLQLIFLEKLGLKKEDVQNTDYGLLLPAMGTALEKQAENSEKVLSSLLAGTLKGKSYKQSNNKFEPALFESEKEYESWTENRFFKVKRASVTELQDKPLFLGIDSGSTTTKLALIDNRGYLISDFYTFNKGNHIQAVYDGICKIKKEFLDNNKTLTIGRCFVTGYGEDLIKAFYKADNGVVEPMAHLCASKYLIAKPSFILDIGGQDMKAIFIEGSNISRIEINEACSSGCGSFIQNFAETLNYSITDFARIACRAKTPSNLGSRCTIFMNSLVKQHIRDGAAVSDLSAGLAYSIARNAVEKMLKIKDIDILGDTIVLQGGAFINPAIHRAFEKFLKQKVICPDITGLMGAYGASLLAMDDYAGSSGSMSRFIGLKDSLSITNHGERHIQCSGCENNCKVVETHFNQNDKFYTGHRCNKYFSNNNTFRLENKNFADYKIDFLFNRNLKPRGKRRLTIGIPRCLNTYDDFPFWCTLFTECGIEVVLSSPSNNNIFQKGIGTITSDSICFPAKLAHGHVIDLCEKGVDRLFFPLIKYIQREHDSQNSFNCPIITGYSNVINSSIDPWGRYDIPMDKPSFSFRDENLFKKKCFEYFREFNISKKVFKKAFGLALKEQMGFKINLQKKAESIIQNAKHNNRKVIVLAGRPYHIDELISHNISQIIEELGIEIITEDSLPAIHAVFNEPRLTTWAYTNRIYNAAGNAAQEDILEIVYLNSFGCGPDAVAIDEVKKILNPANKYLTVIRIDEMASPDSVRLRLRTLIESFKLNKNTFPKHIKKKLLKNRPVKHKNKKTMLLPFFSHFHSPLISPVFADIGWEIVILPPSDKKSEEIGMKYINNEICYPAILVVGDVLKAIMSGKYDTDTIVIGMCHTGGQCRLSSYRDLLINALQDAGYPHIPVEPIVLSIAGSGHTALDHAPLKLNKGKFFENLYNALLFGDILFSMYYSVAAKEVEPGTSFETACKIIDRAVLFSPGKDLMDFLPHAVEEFHKIEIDDSKPCLKIGIVGEIYVKYSPWANMNVLDWLSHQGLTVVLPPLSYVLPQMMVNRRINQKEKLLDQSFLDPLFHRVIAYKNQLLLRKINRKLKLFKYYRKFHNLSKRVNAVGKIIDPVNQYGEGWMLAAEVMLYAEEGINDILCLQPFGCIANQVVAKGIEKKLKKFNPKLNILYIDLDFDTCEANYFNRLHLLVDNIKRGVS